MLCAATFGSRAQFDRIHDWTRQVLQRSSDCAACVGVIDRNVSQAVADPNNATDGDLLIGLAPADSRGTLA